MTEASDRLDERLDQLFSSVELSGEFERRLMARVSAESQALEQVELEYCTGLIRVAKRRRRLLEFLTLDVVAAGALLIFGESLLVRLLHSAPLAAKDSALWQAVGAGGVSELLVLIALAAIGAMLWPVLDYGRLPE
jgi:hypothetical protein